MNFLIAVVVTMVASFALVPFGLVVARLFGLYLVVEERRCVVFELFGKVRAVIDTPGLHCPWLLLGPFAMLVPIFGKKYVVDLRLDQMYLRSQGVNSEEGAPMGIGVWCEMFVHDPVSYLYKNADPRGSLLANVSNATVRCLSNMKLDRMLEERHEMSRVVREEVSAQSQQWGYDVGSVYVRKVHFRDAGMIAQIEQKVVNRLRVAPKAARTANSRSRALPRATPPSRIRTTALRSASPRRDEPLASPAPSIPTSVEIRTSTYCETSYWPRAETIRRSGLSGILTGNVSIRVILIGPFSSCGQHSRIQIVADRRGAFGSAASRPWL